MAPPVLALTVAAAAALVLFLYTFIAIFVVDNIEPKEPTVSSSGRKLLTDRDAQRRIPPKVIKIKPQVPHHIRANPNANDRDIRLLFIGDSVDRFMLTDWCKSHPSASLYFFTGTSGGLSDEDVKIISSFSAHIRRLGSWEVHLCTLPDQHLTLGFLFLKFGVKPHGPWYGPHVTLKGMDVEKLLKSEQLGWDITDLWKECMQPAIHPMVDLMKGWPHGVVLNSIFWDLAHPQRVEDRPSRLAQPAEWLHTWGQNLTSLMSILRHTFEHPQHPWMLDKGPFHVWFAWRLANEFKVASEAEMKTTPLLWTSAHALELSRAMNNMSSAIALQMNYEILDMMQQPPSIEGVGLRDHVHPTPEWNIYAMNQTILKFLNFRDSIRLNNTSSFPTSANIPMASDKAAEVSF